MTKKLLFILLVIGFIVMIAHDGETDSSLNSATSYTHTTIEKNGLYSWPLVNMNARDIFPFLHKDLPIIGVIDSGVDINNQYIPVENVKQMVLDPESKLSRKEHGTMVAGMFIAKGDGINSPGGTLPGVKIISIQSGTDAGMSIEQLAKAIDLAVENGVQVINISQGSNNSIPVLETAIKNALSRRVIIVASAGNDGEPTNNYPARFDGVIGVSALTKNNTPANFTNLEPTNIFAPGQYLLTTGVNDGNYTWFSGSSAATPLVTSVCVIIKYFKPKWDSHKIKKVLLTYSEKKLYKNREIHILNVRKILDYILSIS